MSEKRFHDPRVLDGDFVRYAVYGTLLFDAVQEAVGGVPIERKIWAKLPKFRRFRFTNSPRSAKGPAIRWWEDAQVNVKILWVPSSITWRYDAFEGLAKGYEIETVECFPKRKSNGEKPLMAYAYVGQKDTWPYLKNPWCPMYFEEVYLEMYLNDRIPNNFLGPYIEPHLASNGLTSEFYRHLPEAD